MRVKRTLGMGLSTRRRKRTKKSGTGLQRRRKTKVGKGLSFNSLIRAAKKSLKNKSKNDSLEDAANVALGVARREVSKKKYKTPRVIPIPKAGGALPLIPILAGISALGGAANGVGSIVRAVNDIIEAKKQLFPGQKKQIGNGLYLAPYRKHAHGLYLAPYQPKN